MKKLTYEAPKVQFSVSRHKTALRRDLRTGDSLLLMTAMT